MTERSALLKSEKRPNPLRHLCTAILLAAVLAVMPNPALAQSEIAPAKFAGTYRIQDWEAMEGRQLYHFFYLHHSGEFLLAAQWPEREDSRAVGTWRVDGEHLSLAGTVEVKTNKGDWKEPFNRTYKIKVDSKGIRLEPVLRKNRFGLLGWPNPFVHYRTAPAPNLPNSDIPEGEKNLLVMIRELRKILK